MFFRSCDVGHLYVYILPLSCFHHSKALGTYLSIEITQKSLVMVHTQRVDGSQANLVFDNILNLQGRAHNHAFVSTPVAVRVATIEYAR